jgi:SAM-dependent methyltransferase
MSIQANWEAVDLRRYSDHLREIEPSIWASPQVSEVSYPEHAAAELFEEGGASFWRRHRSQCLTAIMRRFPPPGTLFDLGGGSGYNTEQFEKAGYPSVLVEPSKEGVLLAVHQRGLAQAVCASLEDAQFRQHSLPSVGLFDVLEHISDDRATLATLHSLLVPGGRLYLTVPAYQALWSPHDELLGHYRRYTVGQVRERFEAAGFDIEFASHLFTFLPPIIWLTKALPYRLGLRRKTSLQQIKRQLNPKLGLGGRLLDLLLGRELKAIERGRSLRFGSTCLVVGRSRPSK